MIKGNCDACEFDPRFYVPGEGPEQANVVVVGEAPGDVELRQGRPFVGPAGKLLNRVLDEVRLHRGECWITNACCCRPVPHRTPRAAEVGACRKRLAAEISSRQPKLIIALGAVAMRALLPQTRSIKQERGSFHYSEEFHAFVLPTYHPAAVLRSPVLYTDLVQDLRKAVGVLNSPKVAVESSDIQYVVLDDEEGIDELAARLREVDNIAVDVEAAGDGRPLCIGFSWKPGTAAVVSEAALALSTTVAKLDAAIEGKNLIAHNFKYDLQEMWSMGFKNVKTGEDTMYQSYVLDERLYVAEERRGVHGLKYLARTFLNAPDYSREVAPYYKEMENCPRDALYIYNAHDAAYTVELADLFRERLGPDEHRVLNELLYPASDALARMEYVGTLVDPEYLACLDYVYTDDIQDTIRSMHEVVGREFNPNSPKQLIHLLYKELQLPVPGRLSSDRKALEAIERYHVLPAILLSYRKLQKLHSTYINGIAEAMDENGRVHTSFNLAVTVTGRLSSSQPNLQNCYSDDTEILTPSGWKLFEELTDQDNVAQWWPDGRIEFVKPEAFIKKHYDGHMVQIECSGVDLLVTPDHRIVSLTRRDTRVIEPADAWLRYPIGKIVDRKFVRGGVVVGGRALTAEERLLLARAVAIQADGSYVAKGSWRRMVIRVRGKRKRQQLVELFGRAVRHNKFSSDVYIHMNDPCLQWFADARTKKFDVSKIASLSAVDLKFFLDQVCMWDGDFTRRAAFLQRDTLKEMVECVQLAATLTGKSTSWYKKPPHYHVVNIHPKAVRYASRVHVSQQLYNGYVYCVTVPSGAVVVRRNNHVVVCGNCARNPEIRNIFIATPGYTLIDADLSQAEVRAACWLSRDEALRSAILAGIDMHVATACLIFNVKPEQVTKEKRQAAKTLNFAILYGMSAHSLAATLKIMVPEAEDLIRRYFAAFPTLRAWIDDIKREVLSTGVLRTPFGRKRHFDLITDANRGEVLRQAVNFPVQSMSSDITLAALIRLDRRIQAGELGNTRLLLTVHDSVVLETAEDAAEVGRIVKNEMEQQVLDGWVPFVADVEIGRRWGSLEQISAKLSEKEN